MNHKVSFDSNDLSYGARYNGGEEDTVSRVNRYLKEKSKFQLNQTLVLQDDEIARLKKRLRMMKQKSVMSDEVLDENVQKLIKKKKKLKKIIHEIKTNKLVVFKEIKDQFQMKKKRLMKNKKKELSKIDEMASKSSLANDSINNNSTEKEVTETEMLNDTINSINEKIEKIKFDTLAPLQDTCDHAKDALNRYKIQAQTKKRRCEELTAKIEEIKNIIKSERKERKMKIKEIDQKSDRFSQKMKARSEKFNSYMSLLENSETDLNLSNNDSISNENLGLRQMIDTMNNRKIQLVDSIKLLRNDYKQKKKDLKNEIAALQEQHQAIGLNHEDKNYLQFIYSEEEFITKIQQKIESRTVKLQKLREENIEIRRKLNECDYILNGRTGNYQRFTKLTKNK